MYEDYFNVNRENNQKIISYVYTRIVKELNISCAKLGDGDCEVCETHKLHLKNVKEAKSNGNDKIERRTGSSVPKLLLIKTYRVVKTIVWLMQYGLTTKMNIDRLVKHIKMMRLLFPLNQTHYFFRLTCKK